MLALLPLLLTPTASAGDILRIGVGHEWAIGMTPEDTSIGNSLSANAGYGFALKIAKLIPEIGLSYAYQSNILIPRAGARLQIGWILTPGVYAHANMPIGGPFATGTLGFDAGVSLHVAIPFVQIGAVGGIQVFGGESGPGIPDKNFVGMLEIALALPVNRGGGD